MIIIIAIIVIKFLADKRKQAVKLAQQQEEIKEKEIIEFIKEQESKEKQLVIDAIEKEKNHFSREIHDGICPGYVELKNKVNDLNYSDKTKINLISEFINVLYDDAKRISNDLAELRTSITPLNERIQYYVSSFKSSSTPKIDYNFEPPVEWDDIDKEIHISLFRIIQEAVNNTTKYANASKIEIGLLKKENIINLTIKDNGIGLPNNFMNKGNGINNMITRVESLGGNINFDSENQQGTSIIIEIPQYKLKAV